MAKKPSNGKAAPRAARSGDVETRLIDAMLDLVATQGWKDTGLNDIAAAASVSLSELHPDHASKSSILATFLRRIDSQVLSGKFAFTDEDSPRDRLFDVLMRRFDALRPHREAIGRIRADLMRKPLGAAGLLPALGCSMAWMLTAAGLDADGPVGRAKVLGATGVWLKTMAVWVDDDSNDMSATMAALDRNLARAGACANFVFRSRFRPKREAA